MSNNGHIPKTEYTLDVIGRYICNTFEEARRSTDRSQDPTARPFDFIILGGGTFGSILASQLFTNDKTHSHRILLLEAGPLVFTEHVQNQSLVNTDVTWGVPWDSDSPLSWNREFQGLAFNLGGRSLFWGGWSPFPMDSELASPPWPESVRRDLMDPILEVGDEHVSYLQQAAHQLGSDDTNDFVNGNLHFALREALYQHLQARAPDSDPQLGGQRGIRMSSPGRQEKAEDALEAPLAVQSTSPRPGFFPYNKFSAIQVLIRAVRMAQKEAEESSAADPEAINARKRLMVVDNTHVIRLEKAGRRITGIVTNRGTIGVPEEGKVFLSMGTIENTRLALHTLPNRHGLIGRNLMAHLRSNLTMRVKRSAWGRELDPAQNPELQSSALFVKGRHPFDDGAVGHFHVQITAAGVGAVGMDSFSELAKKIPDLELVNQFKNLTDEWIVISLRGVGEMFGDPHSPDPRNRITLGGSGGDYDYGTRRALVRLDAGPEGSKETQLWDAMDRAIDELAHVFAHGAPIEYLSRQANGVWQDTPPGPEGRRDPLSASHEEGGTLWMGDRADSSVTDAWGRFHEMDNLYALGTALQPTLGSASAVLTGVALARRTADHLIPRLHPYADGARFESLFDGTEMTFNSWKAVGHGAFALIDGTIVTQPGPGMGLLYYAPRTFGDFTLQLRFRLERVEDDTGVFVRMREPIRPVPDRENPDRVIPYVNPALAGVETGFEVQIGEHAWGNWERGIPDDLDQNRTGAIYGVPIGQRNGDQTYRRGPILGPGKWHELEVHAEGDTYRVQIDGQETSRFTNTDSYRGQSPDQDRYSGYVGLQCHTGRVSFADIRIQVPEPMTMPALAVEPGAIEKVAVVWQGNIAPGKNVETTIKPSKVTHKRRATDK